MRAPLALLLLAAGCAGAAGPRTGSPERILAAAKSAGTGFRVGPEHLLTAAHVVAGCTAVWAVAEGGGMAPARVAAADAELDVAVLHAGSHPPPYARLAVGSPPPGAELVATGYPGATLGGPAARVPFRAILLPLPRPDEQMALRGTARPGMSGSPLVDTAGEVAGMLLAKGDAAAPGSLALGRRLGFPVDGLAVMVPAPWLRAMASVAGVPEPPPGAGRPGPPAVARIVCTEAAAGT